MFVLHDYAPIVSYNHFAIELFLLMISLLVYASSLFTGNVLMEIVGMSRGIFFGVDDSDKNQS